MDEILKRCKASVTLTVNDHRDVYETAAQKIQQLREHRNAEIEPDLEARMIASDTIYELHFYPDTPIGFYEVYGTSLEEVVAKAKECLDL